MAFIPQHKISILSSIWYIILTTWFQHPNILTSLTTLTIQPINQINCPNPLQLPRVIIYESVHCTACSVCNSWYTAEQELTYNISSWEQLWFFVVHITDKLRRRPAAQCYSQSYQCRWTTSTRIAPTNLIFPTTLPPQIYWPVTTCRPWVKHNSDNCDHPNHSNTNWTT